MTTLVALFQEVLAAMTTFVKYCVPAYPHRGIPSIIKEYVWMVANLFNEPAHAANRRMIVLVRFVIDILSLASHMGQYSGLILRFSEGTE